MTLKYYIIVKWSIFTQLWWKNDS